MGLGLQRYRGSVMIRVHLAYLRESDNNNEKVLIKANTVLK